MDTGLNVWRYNNPIVEYNFRKNIWITFENDFQEMEYFIWTNFFLIVNLILLKEIYYGSLTYN